MALYKWDEYVILFGTNPERIEILNRVASGYFFLAEEMMWEDFVLSITRLTDDPVRGTLARLTVWELPRIIKNRTLGKAVSTALFEVKTKTRFCRDRRNRHTVHLSRDLALGRASAKPLETGSRQQMREAIGAVANVLHVVGDHHNQPRVSFQVPVRSGAEHLLYILDDWLELQRRRSEQAARGVMPEWRFGHRRL